MTKRPHIVLVIPRGEVIRNFLYSNTLDCLTQEADVSLVSVVHDDDFRQQFQHKVKHIIPLDDYHAEVPFHVRYLQHSIHMTHWRYVWSIAHRNRWQRHDYYAKQAGFLSYLKRKLNTALWSVLANSRGIHALSWLEVQVSAKLSATQNFVELFREIQPDLVFNGSHFHGENAVYPIQAANQVGIPTVAFVFSWDNMTTQGRILRDYNHLLVWHETMRNQVVEIYKGIYEPEQVTITGTPQFDFHFDKQYRWSKAEFCERLGLNPDRPIILYTTAMPSDFQAEPGHLDTVIKILQEYPVEVRPQLLVRVYAKDRLGTFDEHRTQYANSSDVIFPPIRWKQSWLTPEYEDLFEYNNMLRHADLGINGASTVSLELCIYDKPVINIGYDPPNANLPYVDRWVRHLEFDHYYPIVESGAVMAVYSMAEMQEAIQSALTQPQAQQHERKQLLQKMFGDTLDGKSGERVAQQLLTLATQRK